MNLDIQLLKSKGAVARHYEKNEILFYEDEPANYFYQVIEGSVKLFNYNTEGRQFLQGIFSDGESFGEPPLFIGEKYPSTAVTLKRSHVLRMKKEDFLEMIASQPGMQMEMIRNLSHRLYQKAITSREIVNQTPESRIIAFLDNYKRKVREDVKSEVPFTRQMIADFIGLRVETVIRTLSRMNRENKVDIINRKIVY